MSISSSEGVNIMLSGDSDVTSRKPRWKARNCFATLLFNRKSAYLKVREQYRVELNWSRSDMLPVEVRFWFVKYKSGSDL